MGLLILLALAPLWLVGMFGRTLWTPDEPREADIAWRMSVQSDRSLPQLAHTPFLEKPPLTYWMSGAALWLLGDSPAAARAPNLLYALVAACSVGALALGMLGDAAAAALAAVVALSALIAFRVTVWLAPDAALLCGCALALAGAWYGYRASPGRRKVAGYALMHLGAAIGFMAKSAPGWLVPGLALLTLVLWERRFAELRRWELYAGFALQGLLIGPWIVAVARGAHGDEALRALFWNNVVGRFTRIAAPAELDYTSGHHNWPGKYLLELPVYLLPWTLVVAAALVRAWQEVRTPPPGGTRWRFAIAACLPFIALLSLAATARDIYAAPAMLGFGLLAGLWVQAAQRQPSALDGALLVASRYLVLLIAWALAAALGFFAVSGESVALPAWAFALGIVALVHLAMRSAARAQHAGAITRCLGWTYAGYACALFIALIAASPLIDRWQDLPALARQIRADTSGQPLALLDPDETTIAILDHGAGTPFTVLNSGADPRQPVARWFQEQGREARVLVLASVHAGGALTSGPAQTNPGSSGDTGTAARLIDARAAAAVHRYELPHGRRYVLLGPPT